MSELFGPCREDWQCPGEGAICRKSETGEPGGSCTVPCEDRTPCDYRGVYHHCATRTGETQSYCERRCLNGLDCGREGYTCANIDEEMGGTCVGVCASDAECATGTTCNLYSGRCVTAPVETGSVTGGACASDSACRSGTCVEEVNANGVPSGWVGGYCVGNCIVPPGFNSNNFYDGTALPSGTCAGDAICYPTTGRARGDLGTCYDQCSSDGDCRPGYGCLKTFPLSSGGTAAYSNGLCVPADCSTAGCPAGYSCVTVTGSDGNPRSVCGPN